MKKAILISLWIAAYAAAGFAQGTPQAGDFTAAYDAYVKTAIERLQDVPAFAVVVIKDDKPIFTRAYGVADRETGAKAETDTLFYIASSTKAYTALAAAMLDREGKIRFTDPVTKYTSGITFKRPIPERITIRDLLTHTSGLRNDALVHRLAFTGQIEPGELAVAFADGTAVDEANIGKYRYTNLGYNIYGILLERSQKKRWQDLLQDRVFDPLGLKHTTAYVSRARSKKWKLAAPYVFDAAAGKTVRSVLEKKDNNMQAAGGIFSSISDIGKWLNVNMNEGKLNGKQVIPADLVRAAQTGYTRTVREQGPFTGDGEYGLGWQIGRYGDQKVIYHHGGFTGYGSHFSFMPEKKIAVAVVTNDGTVGPRAIHDIATFAYDWWLGKPGSEADHIKRLDDLVKQYDSRKKGVMSAAADRAKRTWQLTKPFAEYAGKYTNELFGTIEVTALANALGVRMGNMYCVATPFTQTDTIRVEMQPGGNGEVIRFVKNTDHGSFSALEYNGMMFTRISQ